MATNESTGGIESVLKEQRKFPPPPEFSRRAHVQSLADYEALYRRAAEDPEGFWKECAGELFWFKPFAKVLDWNFPLVKWFVGGELNASYNCIDRHLAGPRRNKAALIWEGEPGDSRVLTYQMLAGEVARCANGLQQSRGQVRRPGDDLHADGPRSGDCDAGMRAHRRHPFGGIRRFLGRGAARPHQRCRSQGLHHG